MFGERFLTDPEARQTDREGTAWGELSWTVDFAGGPYRVSGMTREQLQQVRGRFAGIGSERINPAAPSLEIRLYQAASAAFRDAEIGQPYSLDLEHRVDSVTVLGLGFAGSLNWKPNLAGYLWTSVAGGPDFRGVFENFFRALVAYRLAASGGALLHSAGIVHDGGAYLFFGPSGAGKTTISRLALGAGKAIMSDDLNALSRLRGNIVVEKVPFAGDLNQVSTAGAAYPLRGAFRLGQSRISSVVAMGPGEALGSLLSCCPYVNVDAYRRNQLMTSLLAVMAESTVARLDVSRDSDFSEILERLADAPHRHF